MMRTIITTEGGADRSVEASSWEEASDGAVSEAVASEEEVSAVAASEVEEPEVNSNQNTDIICCRPLSATLPTPVGNMSYNIISTINPVINQPTNINIKTR